MSVEITWPIQGHIKIIQNLAKSLENDSLSHAYLFLGPEGIGKVTLAEFFAKTILCEGKKTIACEKCNNCKKFNINSHPDFMELKGKRPVKIEEIRELQKILSLKPYLSDYKVIIIEDASRFTLEASNSFLKTLEEPLEDTVLILTCSDESLLLPTIVSRCQVVKFGVVDLEEMEKWLVSDFKVEKELARNISAISGGRPGIAVKYVKDSSKIRKNEEKLEKIYQLRKSSFSERLKYASDLSKDIEETYDFLMLLLVWFRDNLLFKIDCRSLMINLQKEKEIENFSKEYSKDDLCNLLEQIGEVEGFMKRGINPRLPLEVLLLNL